MIKPNALENFLKNLELDEKESLVLLSVIRLGTQAASIIAKHTKIDRTTCYRILKKLCEKRILSQSKRKGVTVFYLQKTSDIKRHIKQKQQKFKELEKEFNQISAQFETLKSGFQTLPQIQIYEGQERLENFYKDIIERTLEQKLLLIRILGSNTFSQKLEQKELGETIKNFEKELKQHSIKSDILIAQGNLTREWITQMHSFEAMAKLAAGGGATNFIIAGESVFMVSFRDFPVGTRIDHPDIAQTMHFLFDISKTQAK